MVDIMLKLHCHCTTMDNFLFLWNSVEKQEYLIAVQVPFQTCLKLDVCLINCHKIKYCLSTTAHKLLLLSIAMNII